MPQNYRALTRTYRPQSFDDIVSQEHVSNTLKNAIKQDRLSHAYMFCGPRGVGKTTMARVLARTINSIDAGVDAESLNQTLNVVEIDAASNNKVDDIHHLRESVRIPPQNGRYKVFIVDEVHMLSKAAFNALLKTLEEPPAHAIFIFATTEPHKVLPTILSRVQRFDFKRISVDEIVERLKAICSKEGITIDDESLHVIAKKADGALRDALGLMDQAIAFCGNDIQHDELIEALNVVGVDQLFKFISSVEKKDSSAGLQLVDDLMKAGVDIQEFLSSLTEHLRNLYVAINSGRMYLVDATKDTKARYKEAAQAFEEEDLMRMLHMVSDSQLKIRDVQQPRVHFEILLLKLIHMNRSRDLNSLIEDLNQLKKTAGFS
jgi:DNA polymerase-3 subunit gamma/tau